MKLIPQSIKNLFNKLFRRAPQNAVAAPVETAPEIAIETPEIIPAPAAMAVEAAKPAPSQAMLNVAERRRAGIEKYKAEDGVYTFALDITRPNVNTGGTEKMVMVTAKQAELYLMLSGHTPLAGVKTLGASIQNHMQKHFGIEIGKVYFKMKNEKFFIDGDDEFTGLPQGQTYEAVLVPAGMKWKPPVFVPLGRKALPESSPLLSLPTLPPYLHAKLSGGQPPKPNPFAPK